MKKQNSAIEQMIYGNRGNIESVPRNEEWVNAFKTTKKLFNEFDARLKNYPELYDLYTQLQDAESDQYAILINNVYKEAFSFGLAIGQEVFDN